MLSHSGDNSTDVATTTEAETEFNPTFAGMIAALLAYLCQHCQHAFICRWQHYKHKLNCQVAAQSIYTHLHVIVQ